MREVAERAGVSPSTVSLVLRGNPSISDLTRQRVLRAQQELGYTVNRFAQRFVQRTRGRSWTPSLDELLLCLLDVTFDNVAYSPFLHGVVSECQARHLHLLTRSVETSGRPSTDLARELQESGADGIIVSGIVTDHAVAALQKVEVPFVVLGNYWLRTPVSRVEMNLKRVGALLAEEVVRRGHVRVAFVAEKVDNAYETECLQGIQAHLRQRGLAPDPSHIISAGRDYAPVALLVDPFLQIQPRPTALLTTDVRVADECVAELRARQVRVPEDVEIFTVVASALERRSPLCRALNLSLERGGRMAVRRLVELVESPGTEPSATVLDPGGWLPPMAAGAARSEEGLAAAPSR